MAIAEYGIITDDEGAVVELERYARQLSNIKNEWMVWLAGVLMVLMNGLLWLLFPPPNSVSMTATVLSSILLGLLLLPTLRALSFQQDILKQKLQLRMRREIAEGICPVCGDDLGGGESTIPERICCAGCGSVWKMGNARLVGRCAKAAEVFWFVLERLATVLAVVYFVLISLRLVDLSLTVRSVLIVGGIALVVVLAWRFRCGGYAGSRVE